MTDGWTATQQQHTVHMLTARHNTCAAHTHRSVTLAIFHLRPLIFHHSHSALHCPSQCLSLYNQHDEVRSSLLLASYYATTAQRAKQCPGAKVATDNDVYFVIVTLSAIRHLSPTCPTSPTWPLALLLSPPLLPLPPPHRPAAARPLSSTMSSAPYSVRASSRQWTTASSRQHRKSSSH